MNVEELIQLILDSGWEETRTGKQFPAETVAKALLGCGGGWWVSDLVCHLANYALEIRAELIETRKRNELV